MIIVSGDFHGEFNKVNEFLSSHPKVSTILQCGDFGFWPRLHNTTYINTRGKIQRYDQYNLKNKDTKIFWCDGNHEDFESLKNLKNNEIMRNVFYMKRGSILTLEDERKVLFIGGAASNDKKLRIPGYSWFPEELISQEDIYNLPEEKINIVISHTSPKEFNNVIKESLKYYDPSREALSYVLKKYKPELWYFGHMHLFKQGYDFDCKWTCLSAIGFDQRWWIPIEEKK